MSNYLVHYGVPGMKWGVRKQRPSTGKRIKTRTTDNRKTNRRRLTTKQKLLIGAGAVAATLAVVGGVYLYKKTKISPTHIAEYKFGTKVDLSSLSNTRKNFKAGSKLQRISTKSAEDYIGEGKRIYVSYLKKDNKFYKQNMPDFFKTWESRGIVTESTPYVHKLKLKKDITLASEQDVAKAYMKIKGVDQIDHGEYRRFLSDVNGNDPDSASLIKVLSGQGFDGMPDQNDSKWAKAPIILFNPEKIIGSTRSHKLGRIEKFVNVLSY